MPGCRVTFAPVVRHLALISPRSPQCPPPLVPIWSPRCTLLGGSPSMRLPRKIFPERIRASRKRSLSLSKWNSVKIKYFNALFKTLLSELMSAYAYSFGKELISCHLNIALLTSWTDKSGRCACRFRNEKKEKWSGENACFDKIEKRSGARL